MTVEAILARHPVLEIERERRSRAVYRRFSSWLPPEPPEPWNLCLFPFTKVRPLKYLLNDALSPLLEFFATDPDGTLRAIEAHADELTRAVETLSTPSATWEDERALELKTAADYARFDQVWHPEYHRYAEHAFNHLIQIPLAVLGQRKNKDYLKQSLSNRVAILRSESALAQLAAGFESTVRNSIAHGSVRYTQFGARYVDRNRSLELYPGNLAEKFDSLVKGSQTLAVGLLLFLLHNWSRVSRRGLDALPLGFLYFAAWGAATHRDFDLQRFVPSELALGEKQLNLVCETPIVSRTFHQFATLHLVKEIDELGGPRFDRAFVSLHCGRKVPSSMAINLAHLRQALRHESPAQELAEIVDGSILWHDTPTLVQKLVNLRLALQTVWANHKDHVFQEWRKVGLVVPWSLYHLRGISNRSGVRLRRIQGHAALKHHVEPFYKDVRGVALHAIRKLRRRRISASREIGRDTRLRLRPSHVWLVLYRHDDLERRFSGRILNNEDALVEVEWKSRWSRSQFTFIPNPDEIKGRIRLKYSPRVILERRE